MVGEEKVKMSPQQVLDMFNAERAKLENIQRNVQAVQEQLNAIDGAILALKEIKDGGKIMVPLGAGIYANAVLETEGRVHISMAGKVFKNTKTEDAVKTLEQSRTEARKNLESLIGEQNKITQNLNSLGMIVSDIERRARDSRTGGN